MKIFEVIDPLNFNSIKEFIEINCSDILKFYKETGNMLYRGIKNNKPYLINNPVKYRTPVDTPVNIQYIVDVKLEAAGFTALRSNSIFCFGNSYNPKFYGRVYMVFPFNGFSYTWSLKIKDLYDDYASVSMFSGKAIKDMENMSPKEVVDIFDFVSTNLKTACNTPNEILIHGKCLLVNAELYENKINKFISFYYYPN